MAKRSNAKTDGVTPNLKRSETEPLSVKCAEESGLTTSLAVIEILGLVGRDVLARRITPAEANAFSSAIGKMIRMVDLQYKHGTQGAGGGRRILSLQV